MPSIKYAHDDSAWTGGKIIVPNKPVVQLSFAAALRMSAADLTKYGLVKIDDPTPTDPTPEELRTIQLTQSLTAVQFHAMLRIAGKWDATVAAIDSMSSPDKEIAQARLDYSLSFERNHPLILSLAPLIGLTSGQVDDLWIAALSVQ